MANDGIHGNLDSGGTLVTLLDLAGMIASTLGKSDIEIISGNEQPSKYFGNYKAFNSFASDIMIELKSLEEQILETLKAFRIDFRS